MGQQQLLLIALGIIIVGIAIFVGITLFRSNAIETKRDHLINECMNIASVAQQYYYKPVEMGGGGRSFNGWSIPQSLKKTGNGRFELTDDSSPDSYLTVTAVGNEVVTGNDSIEVEIDIYPSDYDVTIIR